MRIPRSQPKTNALNIKEPTNRKNEILGIANVMSEQVKMPNRHFLRSDIFTFGMVYSFYFRLFSLNELNRKIVYYRG